MNPDNGRIHRACMTAPDFPPDWPKFKDGDEFGPVLGWYWTIKGINIEAQTFNIQPSRKVSTSQSGYCKKYSRNKRKRMNKKQRGTN